jgi:hypothetical protein
MPLCRGQRRALPLPGAGERSQRGEVSVAVISTLVVYCRPDLVGGGSAEHVQNLMSLVSRVEQTHCRLPYLGRRVVPQLSCDDLVHCEVQPRIDRAPTEVDLAASLSQHLIELGMLVADHERAHLRITKFPFTEAKLGKDVGVSDETPTIEVTRSTGASTQHAFCRTRTSDKGTPRTSTRRRRSLR